MKFERRNLADLRPAEYNPRKNLAPEDPEYIQIRNSLTEFGYADPIVINADGTIIKGHQRRNVMMDLGYTEAEVIVLDIKDKAKEKTLNIALNKITGKWDEQDLLALLDEIDLSNIDVQLSGFTRDEMDSLRESIGRIELLPEAEEEAADWFSREERDGTKRQSGNDEYNEFLEKFEQKKTTDDCYTPEGIYDAVADWVASSYGLDRKAFCRPFYPGGDYARFDYSGKVVVDNPPFSILAQIRRFYTERGIRYFLFAPSLTLFTGADIGDTFLAAQADVTYENEANVRTSFVTNLEDGECIVKTTPDLTKIVQEANDEILAARKRKLPKYEFPDYVLTAAKAGWFSLYGVDFQVKRSDCVKISTLDAMKDAGKEGIFGGAFLLSEKAAAEKAAAEKAAAEKWQLSEREWAIVRSLGKGDASDG